MADSKLEKLVGPTHLRVDLLDFAYEVTNEPHFSWWDHAYAEQSFQQAFQIVLVKRLHDIANQNYFYDSGWVDSANNTSVVLPELKARLADGELYYWQVRVKDNYDNISYFSEPEKFVCQDVIDTADLHGIWSPAENKDEQQLAQLGNVAFLRSPKFEINKENVDSAFITAFSHGSEAQFIQGFDLNVNGKNVGVGSARAQADYYGDADKTGVYYNKYDVTEYLENGDNVISALVGGTTERRAFWAKLDLFTIDGKNVTLLVTDENWKALDASSAFGDYGVKIRSIYFGMVSENVDMRFYPQGWQNVNFNDNNWANAQFNSDKIIADNEVLVPYRSENSARLKTNELTKKVTKLGEQNYLLDLGKEIIGSLSINLSSDVAQRVNVLMGEQLNEDGHVRHHIAAGPDYVENWTLVAGTNEFTTFQVKNFRYVELVGFEGKLNPDEINGWAIEQPFDENESEFSSDNELLNREYELSKYTIKATNQDIFVDSQARERRPYEGDLLVNGLTSFVVSSNYSLDRHTLDYLIDNPTWPEDYKLFNIEMAWLDYMYTGNSALLNKRYENLKIKLNRGKGEDSFDGASSDFMGNLKNGKGVDNFDEKVGLVTNNGLVDWPIPERDGFVEGKYNTPFNAVFYGAYQVMAQIAEVTGHDEDVPYFTKRANTIKEQMIARLYDKQSGRFYDSLNEDLTVNKHTSHHASAYALCYGVYDGQEMSNKVAKFVANDGEFIGSVYFIYFMLKGLIDSGHADEAITLLTNPNNAKDAKTFAAILDQLHATIAPEAWSNHYKPNMTLSHPWGATPGLTIVQGIMGIVPLKPGFEEFRIRIQPGELSALSVKTPSARGIIQANYKKEADQRVVSVSVPMNSKAKIELSDINTARKITLNGKAISLDNVEDGLNLASGKYTIEYR